MERCFFGEKKKKKIEKDYENASVPSYFQVFMDVTGCDCAAKRTFTKFLELLWPSYKHFDRFEPFPCIQWSILSRVMDHRNQHVSVGNRQKGKSTRYYWIFITLQRMISLLILAYYSYLESTGKFLQVILQISFLCDTRNLCCTHLSVGVPRNLDAHLETGGDLETGGNLEAGSNLILDFPLLRVTRRKFVL